MQHSIRSSSHVCWLGWRSVCLIKYHSNVADVNVVEHIACKSNITLRMCTHKLNVDEKNRYIACRESRSGAVNSFRIYSEHFMVIGEHFCCRRNGWICKFSATDPNSRTNLIFRYIQNVRCRKTALILHRFINGWNSGVNAIYYVNDLRSVFTSTV